MIVLITIICDTICQYARVVFYLYIFLYYQELAQRVSTTELREAELTSQLTSAEEREQEAEAKVQDVLDRIATLNATTQDMAWQIDKLKQDKYVLRALITELDVSYNISPTGFVIN